MKDDIMMTRGYSAVRDKSQDRNASSEDEMNFNEHQVLKAAGMDNIYRSDNMPLINPTRNSNIKIDPGSGD